MKKALCILYDDCLAKGWKINDDFAFVLNVHDEYQTEVKRINEVVIYSSCTRYMFR